MSRFIGSRAGVIRSRIAARAWRCGCCGKENDQRACAQGPPLCFCEKRRPAGYLHEPRECANEKCRKCPVHCRCHDELCACRYGKAARNDVWSYFGHDRDCPARTTYRERDYEAWRL